MGKYLFEFGRDPKLSKYELLTYMDTKNLKFKEIHSERNFMILELDKTPNIDRLGGTVKICKVVSDSSDIEEVEYNLDKTPIYNKEGNKLTYYINNYSSDLINFLEPYLKNYFKEQNLKAQYRKTSDPKNLINKNYVDFVIFRDFICLTEQVTNSLAMKKRDLQRPVKDKTVSFRVAKIMINLSGIGPKGILVDPFCSVGTILQEGLLMNLKCVGLDKNIDGAKKNLGKSLKLHKDSAKHLHRYVKKVDAIVTVPPLGPQLRKLPSDEEAKKILYNLRKIYDGFLESSKKVLNKEGKIVLIVPIILSWNNKENRLNIEKMAENHGFVVKKPVFQLFKQKSKILRTICVLEHKL